MRKNPKDQLRKKDVDDITDNVIDKIKKHGLSDEDDEESRKRKL